MNDDKHLFEEYIYIRNRTQVHESRGYQMLIFSVGGFATVLGFSDKIPHEIIPFILMALLILTTSINLTSREHQLFVAAFLFELYQTNKRFLTLEGAYYSSFFSNKRKSMIIKHIGLLHSWIMRPYSIITIASLVASIYFAKDYILKELAKQNLVVISFYVSVILLGYVNIVRNIYLEKKLDFTKFRSQCRTYLKQDIENTIQDG